MLQHRHSLHIGWLALSCLALVAVACNKDTSKDGGQKPPAGKDATTKTLDEFRTEMNKAIDSASAKIDKLTAKAKDASGEAKENLEKQIKDLEGKRTQAQDKLKELEGKAADSWHHLRDGISNAVDDLSKSTDAAWDKLTQ
ncbi:MAG: hypothetical protein AB7K24_05805 [Gemmataceae bacterium]